MKKYFLALACLAAGLSVASAQAKKHYGGFVGPETPLLIINTGRVR